MVLNPYSTELNYSNKMQASIAANTWVVSGAPQTKNATSSLLSLHIPVKEAKKSWIHKWEKHIREKKMIARMEREQIIWRDRMPLCGVFMHFYLLSTMFVLAGNK
ncbi:uncharacterized protein LOC119315984 [Triticum dicoccoides]|uniref:uncharacterized protein LOC119315984 n=1 Tax=Triticum dicoccoides TaxID=85692 RepID=UPI001890BCFC|nr:uncharacterized protein LOC119315984 [Triticum dicoccoides]